MYPDTGQNPSLYLSSTNATYSHSPLWNRRIDGSTWGEHTDTTGLWRTFCVFSFCVDMIYLNGKILKQVTGRVGVVAITLASHARGREFNPRIRYFSTFLIIV